MDAYKLSSGANGMVTRVGVDSAAGIDEACETVRHLKAVLRPVEPSPVFREALRDRLVRAARKDQGLVQIAPSNERTREMLVGAALLSVAGALVYWWRSRVPQEASRAAVLIEKGQSARKTSITAACARN